MNAVLSSILPVFLIISLGFLLGKTGTISADGIRGLGKYVLTLALPALIFKSLAARSLAEIAQIDLALVYLLGSLGAFAIGVLWFRVIVGNAMPVVAIRALGMSFSNTGFIGIPVALQFLGAAAAVPIALALLIENVVLFPLALILAELGTKRDTSLLRSLGSISANLARSPLIIAIVLGLVFSVFTVPLPAFAGSVIDLLAASSAPVALIAVGGDLVGVRFSGKAASIAAIATGKIIIHPALVILLVLLVGIEDQDLRTGVVLLSAMPMLSIFPLLAGRSGDEEVCSAALLVTTTLSFFTISAILLLLA